MRVDGFQPILRSVPKDFTGEVALGVNLLAACVLSYEELRNGLEGIWGLEIPEVSPFQPEEGVSWVGELPYPVEFGWLDRIESLSSPYLHTLSTWYHDLGWILKDEGLAQHGVAYLEFARIAARELITRDPSSIAFRVSMYQALGLLGWELGCEDPETAESYALESVVHTRKCLELAEGESEKRDHTDALKSSFLLLSEIYNRTGDPRVSESYAQALDACRALVRMDPTDICELQGLGVVLQDYGAILRDSDRRAARKVMKEELEVDRRLAELTDGEFLFRRSLARTCRKVAEFEEEEDRELSKPYFDEALGMYRALEDESPDDPDFKEDLSVVHFALGKWAEARDSALAEYHYLRSVELEQWLLEHDPSDLHEKRNLVCAYDALAQLLEDSEPERTLDYYHQSSRLLEELVRDEPENLKYLQDLSIAYEWIGSHYEEVGRLDMAGRYMEHAIRMSGDLVELQPENAKFNRVHVIQCSRAVRIFKDDPFRYRTYLEAMDHALDSALSHGVPKSTFEDFWGWIEHVRQLGA